MDKNNKQYWIIKLVSDFKCNKLNSIEVKKEMSNFLDSEERQEVYEEVFIICNL